MPDSNQMFGKPSGDTPDFLAYEMDRQFNGKNLIWE